MLSNIKNTLSLCTENLKQFFKSGNRLVVSRVVVHTIFSLLFFVAAVIWFCVMANKEPALMFAAGGLMMGFLTVSFYISYKNNEFIILYGVCESKDEVTPGIVARVQAITDKTEKRYEYRVVVTNKHNDDSYIFLILPNYNRMKEGASYEMLFRRADDGEYTERNLVTFRQVPQEVE